MRYFVDTNVFLDLIVENRGDRFEKSKNFLDMARRGRYKIVTSDLVIAEIVWVLQSFYKMERIDISRAVSSLMNISGLKLLKSDDWRMALQYFVDKKIKYIDATIASVAAVMKRKISVVSYDKEFDKLGILRVEPSDIL